MRRYHHQREELFYPHILCNSFSNQHQLLFSRATTQLSTTKLFFTLCRESPSLIHVLSNVARIWIRAQSESHYSFRLIYLRFLCFAHFPNQSFFSSRRTSKTSSDQDQLYSSLVKAFMEKIQNLESDFQRYG